MLNDPSLWLPSDDDVRFYNDNGYWIAPPILPDLQIDMLRRHHAAVVAGRYETGRTPWFRDPPEGEPVDRVVKIDNSHWSDATMACLALHPVIGLIAACLSGAKGIRLWHDQLLLKPPDCGIVGNVGWHQDYRYWQCAEPANMLTAWVALDDVTEANGCMQVVPGSHRWGLLPEGDFFDKDLASLQRRIEAVSGQPFEALPVNLPVGSVSFHHCLTIHGSGPNSSTNPRRSLVIHMMPDGTRYRARTSADGHMNVRLLSGASGDPFAGPYFPVMYRDRDMANPWYVA